ncbi:MAG: hypothetical protein V1845_04160 [bacterium]
MPTDFLEKLRGLPEPVKKILLSNLTTEEISKTTTSYGLTPERQAKTAKLIGQIFVGELPLEKMLEALEKTAALPEPIAAGIASSLTKTLFVPIKSFFPAAELLAQEWSQKAVKPTNQPQTLNLENAPETTAAPQPAVTPEELIGRDISTAMLQNEKIGVQIISEKPIKLADSPNLRTPSVANWLADYAKYKSQFPEQDIAMIRIKYIHDSPNAKGLSEQERNVLNFVLKSFDEHTLLPFSKKTGLLSIEKLIEAQAGQKTQPQKQSAVVPTPAVAAPKPVSAPPLQPAQRPTQPYIPPPPVRPAPPKQMSSPASDTRVINLGQQQKPSVPPPQQVPQQKPLTEGNVINLRNPGINE